MERTSGLCSAYDNPTFGKDGSFTLDKPVGSASISPCGRDVVLASRQGLHIIDLDCPWSPPRHLPHHTPWEVADVQWSPFPARDYWVVSTSNQKALVWNLAMANSKSSVEHVLHAHSRAITDINFSAHHPDILATCAVDSFVHCWDIRHPTRPAMTFCDWFAGATQVKWNRQDPHIIASSHDKFLRIWDDRKGAFPLRSIEAHATKIYGIDWNRTETDKLVTCSLDKTIKFWDTRKESSEPDCVLHTLFPVWRARHTPFGFGLLAMPQREDYDLHLYDRRENKCEDRECSTPAVHKFGGHVDHVKEFLWRPRGNVTSDVDDREFQLVSWGTDRMLRLHQVEEDVLGAVGYEKGVKRNFNVTRQNAVYKTFRDTPSFPIGQPEDYERLNGAHSLSTRSAISMGMSKSAIPFIGGYGSGGFMSHAVGLKSPSQKEIDPIAWMRGVKIGKRETSPDLHQSISSIVSPSLRVDPSWDVFESLGEEITHVGEKFRKVKFETIDIQRRFVVVSLSGPWGPGDDATYIQSRIDFPLTYPDSASPTFSVEKTASLTDEILSKIYADIGSITASFVSRQRSSLEATLRYLLGEQTLEESLLWLKKRVSVDLESTQDLNSSSSDDDDEIIERYGDSQANNLEASDPMIASSNAQYNVPLPKACGALWADDGRLVCFFPSKSDQESSLLEMSIRASDRSSRKGKTMFEGFGRLQNTSTRQRRHASTLETIESGDSDFEESSTSSDSSSSSDGFELPQHHFLPNMAWRSNVLEATPGVSLDDSQKSSGGSGLEKSSTSKGSMFISIHALADLLPAKQGLAKRYVIGKGTFGSVQNAQVASESENSDLASVWSFIDLLLQDIVPLELISSPRAKDSIMIVARCAASGLKSKDSAIDLPFDDSQEQRTPIRSASVKWGNHPFGRRWFVDSLFRYYEQLADIQMLAMLSCAFSEARGVPSNPGVHKEYSSSGNSTTSLEALNHNSNGLSNYYPSEGTARAQLHSASPILTSQVDYQNISSGPHSSTSSTGAPISEFSTVGTTPPGYRPLRMGLERRESQTTSLSTSPEQYRHTHRSSSNLSALAASFSRPFSFTASAASSPPNMYAKKRSSPSGSYLGTQSSTISWSPALFGRSATITEDPKPNLSFSVSEIGEEDPSALKRSGFKTRLKHQDRFQNDGYANVPLLDPSEEWRYKHYREAYAHLLYIWGLPIARAEILSYNQLSTPDFAQPRRSAQPAASLLPVGESDLLNKPSEDTGDATLAFKNHCGSCSSIISSKSPTRRCQTCSTLCAPPLCLLCNTLIRGLYSPCLNCGHILHDSCRNFLLSLSPMSNDPVHEECISGCGCVCAEHNTAAVNVPDLTAKKSHEVSPAITVIGDVGLVFKADEPLESRDAETGEWEDMAYESLARNLRPRKEIRAMGSHIWPR